MLRNISKVVWPTVFFLFFQVLATIGHKSENCAIQSNWNSALLLAHMIDTATTTSCKKLGKTQ